MGVVELVEIPTINEWNDNIVAYWVPKQPPTVGEEIHWAYSLAAVLADPDRSGLLSVQSTRLAPAHDGKPPRFVIDFDGKLAPVSAEGPLEVKIQCTGGDIGNVVLEKNEMTGGWRVVFDYLFQGRQETELRLFLHVGERTVSETWTYNWSQSAGMGGE